MAAVSFTKIASKTVATPLNYQFLNSQAELCVRASATLCLGSTLDDLF